MSNNTRSSRVFTYSVTGLMCSDCSQTVKSFLKELTDNPDFKVYVDWENEEVSVQVAEENQQSDVEIRDKIKQALDAYQIKPVKPIWHDVIKGLAGTFFGLALLILMASGLAIPLYGMFIIGGFSLALTLFLGFESYQSAFIQLFKARKLTMDSLFTVSTLTAIGVSIASLFVPWLPQMFDAPLMIFGLRRLGVALEKTAKRKMLKGVDFRDRIPQTAKKLEVQHGRKHWVKVDVNALKKGDTITVFRGGVIPVDGICQNKASLYQTIYNGNTESIDVKKGSPVRSGMQLSKNSNHMIVTVTAEANDSYLKHLDKCLDNSKREKVQIETKIDKFIRYFVPGILIFTLVMGIILGCLFPPAFAIQSIVAILVATCPCPLAIVTSVAIVLGMKTGLKHGIEFKRKEDLLMAAEIDTVVIDVNGTLTTGIKEVGKVQPIDEQLDGNQMLEYMYLLEENFKEEHAVAKSIYEYAKKKVLSPSQLIQSRISQVKKHPSGVSGIIDKEEYAIGNRTMMKDFGIHDSQLKADFQSNHAIYLARGEKIIGVIDMKDQLREDAIPFINQLKKAKLETYLCTGSDMATAKCIADQLDIDSSHIKPDCIPMAEKESQNKPRTNKVQVIQSLKSQGRHVAFIGDGGNDAPSMSQCLGFLMRSPLSDAATEDNAGVVITGSLLMPVAAAFIIAKRAVRNIQVSFAIGVTYNMAALLACTTILCVTGFVLNPAIGVALMALQACLILAVAFYYKHKSLPLLTNNTLTTNAENEKSTTPAFLGKIFGITSLQPASPKIHLESTSQCSHFKSFMKFFSIASSRQNQTQSVRILEGDRTKTLGLGREHV